MVSIDSILPDGIVNAEEDYVEIYQKVQAVYLSDNRPWVIGYSGGKDSTATLQLVWSALKRLRGEQLTKKVYIISSDTYVETPIIIEYIKQMHALINKSAEEQQLPFEAFIVRPAIEDTFWVNLIGRGYPAPYNRFRWCTDRLKIEPANKFILDKVAVHGEVVVVLGARFAESANRSGSMGKRKKYGEDLTLHSTLPNAYAYTPIEEWYTEEVWEYLTSVPSPWGSNNHELLDMYRNAQEGECPLVIDKSTPSCGNSRFGCWTCTVVKKDVSLESTIKSGERWLAPLPKFRDWLAATGNPDQKTEIRSIQRRNGKIQYFESDGKKSIIWGPFALEFRKTILEELLKTENAIRKNKPEADVFLISEEELMKIRRLWMFEEGDWEDSLPSIYERITGRILDVPKDDLAGMGGMELSLLERICQENDVPVKLVTELFDAERKQFGMRRRSSIFSDIDRILRKNWKSKEEVFKEVGIEI